MFKFFILISSLSLIIGSPINDQQIFFEHEHLEAKTKDPEIYRLPGHVIPKSYNLRIFPDLEKFIFTGDIEIAIQIVFTTDTIVLHSKVAVTKVELRNQNQLETVTYALDEANELLIVKATKKLPFDTEYHLTITFNGVLNDELHGFYRTWYKDDKGNKKWLAATQFEPTSARRAFPCFDEPRYKAPFTISVACYTTETAISNMPIDKTSGRMINLNDRVWVTFKSTPPISTYLVAFTVGPFSSISNAENTISVYARPNAIQHTTYALQQSEKLLPSMTNFVSVRYILPKLDVVALPDFRAGAMENWGLTTYRERFAVINENNPSETHKTFITEVISHEFSHQWFGDLVTPAWWDYLWLNEGFATYFEYYNTDTVSPDWDMEQFFVNEVVQYALWKEPEVGRAMTSRVKYVSETRAIFDVISYEKAGSVIRMIEHIMTTNGFRSALNRYLLDGFQNYGGVVDPNQLFRAFEEQASVDSPPLPPHVSITKIMELWTTNIGYPIITVIRDPQYKRVNFTQSTYITQRSEVPAPIQQEWIVPITFITKSQPEFFDLRPSLWSVPGYEPYASNVEDRDWILCNLNQVGYYRVNYCPYGWKLLIEQLKDDHTKIPLLNRAQLIDDAFVLAMDNLVPPTVPFKLISYLEKEKDITPWMTVATHISRIYFKFKATTYFSKIRAFAEKTMEKAYQNLGFEMKSEDRHIVKVGKPRILQTACAVGVQKCVDESLKMYQENIKDLSKVPSDLKRIVFCNALRYGQKPEEVYNNIWSVYLKSNIADDVVTILTTLGCIKDEQHLKLLLSKIFDPKNEEIRTQDYVYIWRNFFTYNEGVTATIKFLIEKASAITEIPKDKLELYEQVLSFISTNVQNGEQIKLLEELMLKFKSLDQKRYGKMAKTIHKAHCEGSRRMKSTEKLAERLSIALDAVENNKEIDNGGKDDHDHKPPQPSAAPVFVSSWLCFVFSIFFTSYSVFL